MLRDRHLSQPIPYKYTHFLSSIKAKIMGDLAYVIIQFSAFFIDR